MQVVVGMEKTPMQIKDQGIWFLFYEKKDVIKIFKITNSL